MARFALDNRGMEVVSTQPGPPGPSGVGTTIVSTVDNHQLYQLIAFGDTTVKAVPVGTVPPAQPTGLTPIVHLTHIALSWAPAARAATYVVYRDSALIAFNLTATSFVDDNITIGDTYSYVVRAYDTFGEPSADSAPASAFVDPALDRGPTVTVTVFPTPVPGSGSPSLVRVNGYSVDGLTLALALSAGSGTLTPTADVSVWTFTP